ACGDGAQACGGGAQVCGDGAQVCGGGAQVCGAEAEACGAPISNSNPQQLLTLGISCLLHRFGWNLCHQPATVQLCTMKIVAETHEITKEAYKDGAMFRAQVFRGHKSFKEGFTFFENELCFERPSTERNDENVQKNDQLVHED
ncbi:GVQW3-like 4, partial [Homarus americanus]